MKTMNEIAERLNLLLELSRPYSVDDTGMINYGNRTNDKELWDRLQPILENCGNYVDKMEIINAAKERRTAQIYRPAITPNYWRSRIMWTHSARLWKYCAPQIKAVVDAFNEEKRNEYEIYRSKCEAGVFE